MFKHDNNLSKVVPGIESHSFDTEGTSSKITFEKDRSEPDFVTDRSEHKKETEIFNLPDDALRLILEYLVDFYASVRLSCRALRDNFDEMSYRVGWSLFAKCDKSLFRFESIQKYQMIRLAEICLRSKSGPETLWLQHQPFTWLQNLRARGSRSDFLLGLSTLIKLEIIKIDDKYDGIWKEFEDKSIIRDALRMGIFSLTSVICSIMPERLIKTLGPTYEGFLWVVRGGSPRFTSYIADFITMANSWPAILSHGSYCQDIIDSVINARDWDILKLLFSLTMERNSLSSFVVKILDSDPEAEAVEIIRWLLKTKSFSCAHRAASEGRLAALIQLDSLGFLLQESRPDSAGETPLHAAAFNNQVPCLVFLIVRLNALTGRNYLNVSSKSNYLPLHAAALGGSSEALQEIIRQFPHYEPQRWLYRLCRCRGRSDSESPLIIAVDCGHFNASQGLLEAFPELINIRCSEDGSTAIHRAVKNGDSRLVGLLVRHAPPSIIQAVDQNGDTAMHIAARLNQLENLSILVKSHLFSGFEPNNHNETPFDVLNSSACQIPLPEIVGILNEFPFYIE